MVIGIDMELAGILEFIGAMTGIAGALILAKGNQAIAVYAWSLWIISSISLMGMAWINAQSALMAMQMVFFGINLYGFKNAFNQMNTVIEDYEVKST